MSTAILDSPGVVPGTHEAEQAAGAAAAGSAPPWTSEPETALRTEAEPDARVRTVSRPETLPALTGMRALFSLNILFFHFHRPVDFGVLAPAVSNGYVGVTFFFLLSGFILGYIYGERAEAGQLNAVRFYKSWLAWLYSIYMVALLISLPVLPLEWAAHTRGDFWLGMALTPVMLQGWHPTLMNFWNTPAWTLSCEVMFYLMLPWLLVQRWPRRLNRIVALMAGMWVATLAVPALYEWVRPDGIAHPDRYSYAFWVRGVRMWPVAHLPIFVFGILLSRVQRFWRARQGARVGMAVAGMVLLAAAYESGERLPYLFAHNGLLAPISSLLILGMSGRHWLARVFSGRVLMRLGTATYCLYLLHFSAWTWLHDAGWRHAIGVDRLRLERLGLGRLGLSTLDPWLSYLVIVALAYAASRWIERPGRRWMERVLGIEKSAGAEIHLDHRLVALPARALP